jgi:hypothetical protein
MAGGSAPDSPPITMFCGVRRFQSQGVDHDIEEDGESQQPAARKFTNRPITATTPPTGSSRSQRLVRPT